MSPEERYDSEAEDAGLEHDAMWRERVLPEWDWDESEVSMVVAGLVGRGFAGETGLLEV